MSKKDMPGATAGLIAAASENGPAVANPGGNKVAPGGNSIFNSRFNDVWLFKNGVIELNMLKVEPGRKMKFDPEVWTRIDPAGSTLVVDVVDVVVPVPVVVVVVVAAVSAILEGKGPPLEGKGLGTGGRLLPVTELTLLAGWEVVSGRGVTRSLRTGTLLTGCTTGGLTIGARNITGGRPGTWETAANTNVPIKARVPNRLAITRMTHLSCRTCVLA
jgi:hypothetical protein